MNRKQFIESFGATCKNWTWSWSFVNHDEKFVIFGAWDNNTERDRALILGNGWSHRETDGAKNKGFPQSREHIRLIENAGYRLFTFPMYVSNELKDTEGHGPSKIDHFDPKLTQMTLRKEDGGWYAYEYTTDFQSPEELRDPEKYVEGACKTVTVNAYERNREARAACIKAHGAVCSVCGFDFEANYGPEIKGFTHVHHLVPLSAKREQYELDPVKDLRPVCPNCHAVIHYGNKLLSIEEVKERIRHAGRA
jgi:5-methylcytosine-specific restriction protein A